MKLYLSNNCSPNIHWASPDCELRWPLLTSNNSSMGFPVNKCHLSSPSREAQWIFGEILLLKHVSSGVTKFSVSFTFLSIWITLMLNINASMSVSSGWNLKNAYKFQTCHQTWWLTFLHHPLPSNKISFATRQTCFRYSS